MPFVPSKPPPRSVSPKRYVCSPLAAIFTPLPSGNASGSVLVTRIELAWLQSRVASGTAHLAVRQLLCFPIWPKAASFPKAWEEPELQSFAYLLPNIVQWHSPVILSRLPKIQLFVVCFFFNSWNHKTLQTLKVSKVVKMLLSLTTRKTVINPQNPGEITFLKQHL